MFRNFKHKPTEVSAVEVTTDYIRSLDPESGPLLPQFELRTGQPYSVELPDGDGFANIGDFIVENGRGYKVIDAETFKARYDPAW